MLLTIQPITLPDWRLTESDVELRFRPTKDFIPDDIDSVISSKAFESYVCTYDEGTLTVPEVQLYTTTDSDLGDNVRYIAEFWDPVKRRRVSSFAVNNFKLSPEIGTQNGEPVEPEWESVAAFNRLYHRNNRSGLNIDLSHYPTRQEVINLISDALNGVVVGGYTNEQIDLMISNLANYVYNTVNNFTLGGNYYTKAETDTIVGTAVSQIFSGVNGNTTTYTKNALNLIFETFATLSYVDSTFYTRGDTDDLLADLAADLVAMFANYYTQAQTVTLVNNALTPYYTQSQVNNIVANAIANYYTKAEVDGIIAGIESLRLTETEYEVTTPSLSNNESYYLSLGLGKSYYLTQVSADVPVRVRVYQTYADRDTDFARLVSERAVAGKGLVADVNLPASKLNQRLAPTPLGVNADDTRNSTAYINIERKQSGSGVINLIFKVIKTEV